MQITDLSVSLAPNVVEIYDLCNNTTRMSFDSTCQRVVTSIKSTIILWINMWSLTLKRLTSSYCTRTDWSSNFGIMAMRTVQWTIRQGRVLQNLLFFHSWIALLNHCTLLVPAVAKFELESILAQHDDVISCNIRRNSFCQCPYVLFQWFPYTSAGNCEAHPCCFTPQDHKSRPIGHETFGPVSLIVRILIGNTRVRISGQKQSIDPNVWLTMGLCFSITGSWSTQLNFNSSIQCVLPSTICSIRVRLSTELWRLR